MSDNGNPGVPGADRGPDPGRRRGGDPARRPCRRARARCRGHQARDPRRRPLDRARLADGRRGRRDDGRARHLAGGRHLRRRLHRRDRQRATAGRPTSCARTTRPPVAQRQVFEKCVAAGVRHPFGTDSGIYPHGLNARQFAYHVRHGQTALEAIRSATVHAAALMGWGTGSAGSRRAGTPTSSRSRVTPGRRPPAGGRPVRDEGRRGRPRRLGHLTKPWRGDPPAVPSYPVGEISGKTHQVTVGSRASYLTGTRSFHSFGFDSLSYGRWPATEAAPRPVADSTAGCSRPALVQAPRDDVVAGHHSQLNLRDQHTTSTRQAQTTGRSR